MDEKVTEILSDWGLSSLKDLFTANKIDYETFLLLEPVDISQLITIKGQEIKFRRAFQEYKETLKKQDTSRNENTSPALHDHSNGGQPNNEGNNEGTAGSTVIYTNLSAPELSEIFSPPTSPQPGTSGTVRAVSTTGAISDVQGELEEEPQPDRVPGQRKRKRNTTENSVEAYLEASAVGSLPLHLFKTGNFDDSARNDLVQYIIQCEFKGNSETVISPTRFLKLRDEIVELFPTEDPDTYYIPRRPKTSVSDGANPRGKLYHKYTRTIGRLRLAKQRSSGIPAVDDTEEQVSVENLSSDLTYLKNCTGSQNEVTNRWNRTSAARLQLLRTGDASSRKKLPVDKVIAYINEYKSLREEWGYTLLEIDFKHLYPESEMSLLENWTTVKAKIKTLAESRKVVIGDSSSNDEETIQILFTIPKLFKPRNVGKWKTSGIEVLKGFLLHVKTIAELNDEVNRLKLKLREVKKTLQPFPVIVGPEINEIVHSYVYIEGFFYRVETPLRAIDVCFKAYHALHAFYPAQSEAPWCFLQRAVYKFNTKWDNQIPAVSTLVKEYQNLVVI